MKRILPALIVLGWIGLVAGPSARAQEEITYYDRAKKMEATVKGTIEEDTPSQLVYKLSTGRKDKIPAADIVDVLYRPAGVSGIDYRKPANKANEAYKAGNDGKEDTRKRAVTEALVLYRELLPRLNEVKPAQRYAQFRMCELLVWESGFDP